MAYTSITLALIRSGKAALYTLFDLVRSNLVDHETRIFDLETGASSNTIPSGVVMAFGGTTPPFGFLECNGDAVSRTTYAALFAVCGTVFNIGGEAGTDFRVPDMRGRTAIGAGTGVYVGATARTVGTMLGEEEHSLTTAEIPNHNHVITDPGHTHTWPNCTGGGTGVTQDTDTNTFSDSGSSTDSSNLSIASTGSGTAHNNMQPSTVVEFIIKT